MLIPNKDLSDVKVTNHGEMKIEELIENYLVYSSSVEQLESIRDQIKNLLLMIKIFLMEKISIQLLGLLN